MSAAQSIFVGVDRLIDRSRRLSDLRVHGLQLLAGRRFRELGRLVPEELAAEERASAIQVVVARAVLERVRAAYDGPLMLIKGLEVAMLYPDPALRPFSDIDLVARDPDEAHRSLLDAGFRPVGQEDAYYATQHHLRPLHSPGLPLVVEIHRRPEWVKWTAAPSSAELFEVAVPAKAEIEGLLAPSAAAHALIVAAHSWSGAPLRRILDLVDVALLSDGLDRAEVVDLARQWDVLGVWRTMVSAADALLVGRRSGRVPFWGRDLQQVRDRSVLENHIRRIAGPFWALPPRRALRFTWTGFGQTFRPAPEESWHEKALRTRAAFRHPFRDLAVHNELLFEADEKDDETETDAEERRRAGPSSA